jgi:hypothetical protein
MHEHLALCVERTGDGFSCPLLQSHKKYLHGLERSPPESAARLPRYSFPAGCGDAAALPVVSRQRGAS